MDRVSLRQQYLYMLKDKVRLAVDWSRTEQNRGIAPPPVEKPYSPDTELIDLMPPSEWKHVDRCDVMHAIGNRRSRRNYTEASLRLEEVSFLLWATQGIRSEPGAPAVYRTVPSAGCRHALETYLIVFRVEGLMTGVYRYLPLSHQLVFEFSEEELAGKLIQGTLGQQFVGRSAVTFVWTTIPARMEWRYDLASYKVIALDAGHVCQNLYLACEAIQAGTCAIAAYDQDAMDRLLHLDGENEFTLYLAPVGLVAPAVGG